MGLHQCNFIYGQKWYANWHMTSTMGASFLSTHFWALIELKTKPNMMSLIILILRRKEKEQTQWRTQYFLSLFSVICVNHNSIHRFRKTFLQWIDHASRIQFDWNVWVYHAYALANGVIRLLLEINVVVHTPPYIAHNMPNHYNYYIYNHVMCVYCIVFVDAAGSIELIKCHIWTSGMAHRSFGDKLWHNMT